MSRQSAAVVGLLVVIVLVAVVLASVASSLK
jgi:hypothetical protein